MTFTSEFGANSSVIGSEDCGVTLLSQVRRRVADISEKESQHGPEISHTDASG